MRFVFDHKLIESFPKTAQNGSVHVSFVLIQLNDGHVPFANVGFESLLSPFQMKRLDSHKNFDGISIPRPAFKLPRGSLRENGHHPIPVFRGEFVGVVDDSIRDGGTVRLPSLNQRFVVSSRLLLLFLFGRHKLGFL